MSNKLKIPSKTKIGGHTISVYSEVGLWDENMSGYFRPSNKTIVLEDRQDAEAAEETYVHELIEAINHLYDLRLPHEQIQILGLNLHQALTQGEGKVPLRKKK